MKALNMKIPDIHNIIKNAVRGLLVFQTYYKEIKYHCKQKGKLN
jgi:hypothetical protein